MNAPIITGRVIRRRWLNRFNGNYRATNMRIPFDLEMFCIRNSQFDNIRIQRRKKFKNKFNDVASAYGKGKHPPRGDGNAFSTPPLISSFSEP